MSSQKENPRSSEQNPNVLQVTIGEPFHISPTPVKFDEKAPYPNLLKQDIELPDLGLEGKVHFYTDGHIPQSTITPMGIISYSGKVSGNAVTFDKETGPLMLSILLLGKDESMRSRNLVIKTPRGNYVSRLIYYNGSEGIGLIAGSHSWSSGEKRWIDSLGREYKGYKQEEVTALFPNDPERISKELEFVIR